MILKLILLIKLRSCFTTGRENGRIWRNLFTPCHNSRVCSITALLNFHRIISWRIHEQWIWIISQSCIWHLKVMTVLLSRRAAPVIKRVGVERRKPYVIQSCAMYLFQKCLIFYFLKVILTEIMPDSEIIPLNFVWDIFQTFAYFSLFFSPLFLLKHLELILEKSSEQFCSGNFLQWCQGLPLLSFA